MAITTTKSAFRKGLADAAPFILVMIPFASLFGILATEAGLNVFETLAFSVVVIAGAAQFIFRLFPVKGDVFGVADALHRVRAFVAARAGRLSDR